MVPQIVTPEYWPVTLPDIKTRLEQWVGGGAEIGKSAGGRTIHGVVLGPETPLLTFGVIGGTHGHEPGGVAAVMNLVAAVVTGKNLLGDKADAIFSQIRWVLIPVLNPDGRARCPNGFAGLSHTDVALYCAGWRNDGYPARRENQLSDMSGIAHIGGLFNDAGVDILHASDGTLEGTASVEAKAAALFFKKNGCHLVIDLHAHAFKPMFYTPVDDIPDELSRRGHAIAEATRARGKDIGFDFAEPECVASGNTGKVKLPAARLYHAVSGALPLLFEGPQGCVDAYRAFYGGKEREIRDPGYGYDQIVRCYLFVITEVARRFLGSTPTPAWAEA